MKKLMKKKVSLFGKSFSVFAIVIVAMIGLAAAALVPFLSGIEDPEVSGVSGFFSAITGAVIGGGPTSVAVAGVFMALAAGGLIIVAKKRKKKKLN